ncbi:DUF3219 family protein [Falsibacillus albus]|uniref:DUF3219 family protein n=1 Tax=Falsibacillus albus TaxID=2478915 RepID=A0A3L7JZE0_9BACI|nr:DUF3219 family protein [Falsibacillus albus]RLQ96133.1 DUF3219 family protein [Falsibacillus albus]
MVKEILLNEKRIAIKEYEEKLVNGLNAINIVFDVSSDDYHDVAILLYEGYFQVDVPQNGLSFNGTIQQYYTSVTNLYEENQVGEFTLSLLEVKE